MRVRERRRAALAALIVMLATLTASIGWLGASGAGAEPGGELVVQPSLGAPTASFLGASPQEAPGSVWATSSGSRSLAHYTDAGGWELLPEPTASPGTTIRMAFGAAAGRTTPRGGVVAAATAEVDQELPTQTLVVRDPSGPPRQAADAGALLEGEPLFGEDGPLLAATDEAGGRTGAYVAPPELRKILHYDGSAWSSEEICLEAKPGCTAPQLGFEAVAIDAGGGESWLLGRRAAPEQGLELFRREAGGGTPVWRQQPLGPVDSLGARYGQAEPGGVTVAPRTDGQPLTVTSAGVWADARLTDAGGAHDATVYFDLGDGEVIGAWCDLPVPSLCSFPLESDLSSGQGRSFAWPPGGGSGSFGTRAITGVGEGAILSLEGSGFRRLTFVGGDAGSDEGAALSSAEEGWLGATPPLQLTRNPQSTQLSAWPVPFRRPLTALAPEPGKPVGGLGSEALAVGMEGQVARYRPGLGWEPEFLLRSSGKRATPTLRAVAWPEPGRAYAVGDGAAMWRWQKATGLWQPDPGAPPNLARANFTGIAFDPGRPSRGYAVGKQGVLLGFGRQWAQEPLPPGVPAEANFTSVAFAGPEALATYKFPYQAIKGGTPRYRGGVIVNDGSGWRVDVAAESALAEAVPQRVAGLPDGGAVIATLNALEGGPPVAGKVIERQGAGAAWQVAPGGSIGFPAALAAVREAGQVRAVISIAPAQGTSQGGSELSEDEAQLFNQPPPGQAPLLTGPYKLPPSGLVVRQTATGWRDEQRQGFPLPPAREGQKLYDLPVRPDPVLALLVAPDGSGGWAVGGDPASAVLNRPATIRTSAVMRYGPAATPPANAAVAPIATAAGTATFALGGHAQCAAACADYAGAGIGPDRWLRAAVGRAAGVPGLRGFLYAGAGVAADAGNPDLGTSLAETIGPGAFAREQAAYARRLGAAAGSLPVFAAASESDLDGAGSLDSFLSAFAGYGRPLGVGVPAPGISPVSQAVSSRTSYSFDSSGTDGPVRVIVLDYSLPALGEPQSCWLAQELAGAAAAGRPAVVVGERDLAGLAPNAAEDRAATVQILVGGGVPGGCVLPGPAAAASAYLFDFPEQNRAYRLFSAGRSIPAFGSGTLGYVTPPAPTQTDFAGASGFLLVSVDVGSRDPATNVAPVGAQLVPSIGSLALDATDGTLLRRSQPALFEALARRPLAGAKCQGTVGAPQICDLVSPPQYIPIPSQCLGSNCASSLLPEYRFSSSEPDIADFVASDPGSTNPRNVLLVKGKPVLDSHSGLLCAFNAGTSIVTISTGGLSYSQKVTVQAGSVQRPCGTTPLRNRTAISGDPVAPPAPAPTPEGGPLPNETPPLPPRPPTVPGVTPAPTPAQPAAPAPPPPPPVYFAPPIAPAVPLVPIVPPPPLPAVQPTPPSGTSQVNAVEEEEEPEEAYESSSAMAALPAPGPSQVPLAAIEGSAGGNGGVPLLLPALALVAAIAAAGIGATRRPRPRRAYQSTNSNRRYR
ncbi:MAG TPA: hypothetical protein VFI03_11065 [Solirubrobacterales bacterium]|nr:hypothetical protein [Solirubrobacterales bacterium]